MLEKVKYRIFDVLVETDDGELIDRIVAVILLILILLNTVAVVLETVEEINDVTGRFLTLEIVSVTIFTSVYASLWLRRLNQQYAQPVKAEFAMHFAAGDG